MSSISKAESILEKAFRNGRLHHAILLYGNSATALEDVAKKTAEEESVAFVDMYELWKKMYSGGVNVTELLANKYNHPVREFHYYTAIKLVEKMFD